MSELDLEKLADEIIRVGYPTYEQAPPGLKRSNHQKEGADKANSGTIHQANSRSRGSKEKEGSGGLPLHPLRMRGIASARRELS